MSTPLKLCNTGHNAHHLKLVLPEFLLSRLIQEREIADMVNEDIT